MMYEQIRSFCEIMYYTIGIFLLFESRLADLRNTAFAVLQPISHASVCSNLSFPIPFERMIADNNGIRAALPPKAVFPSTNQNISRALESRIWVRNFSPSSV